jgi:hypothetical protein
MARIVLKIEDKDDGSVFIDMTEMAAAEAELDSTNISPAVMIALAFQEMTNGKHSELIHKLIDVRLDRMNMRREADGTVWGKDDHIATEVERQPLSSGKPPSNEN